MLRNLVLGLVLATIGVQLVAVWRLPASGVNADEGTYLAMIESLVSDGDLRFGTEDAERLRSAPEGRGHVILQQTRQGVAYSKPILFAVLAAPFYAVVGEFGVVLFNVLALALAVWATDRSLRWNGATSRARWALCGLLAASPVLAYPLWKMTETLQFSLALAGLALSLTGLRAVAHDEDADGDRSTGGLPLVGGLLLGGLVSLRVANGAVAVIPVLAALLHRRFRRAAVVGAGILLAGALAAGFTSWTTGAANPYRALRTSFTPETGYPVGPSADEVESRFVEHRATHWTGLRPRADRPRLAYTSLYFFFGRHTGLLVYFPALFLFGLAALRRPDATTVACAAGFVVTATFFVGWMPGNWFGGESFLGNRYILPAFAAALFAPRRLPNLGAWVPVWALALVLAGSGLASVERVTSPDVSEPSEPVAQPHAHAGIFRLLPYESTAQGIGGRRDRYWTGQFLRFVDPFADVRGLEFRLSTAMPASAEILQAQWEPVGALEVEIEDAPDGSTLIVEHRGEEQSFPLTSGEGPNRIRFDPGPGWRHHGFWWDLGTLNFVRMLRFRLEGPEAGRAIVRWLGDPRAREGAFEHALVEIDVPDRARAGEKIPVRLRVRNESRRIWEARDVTPVRLRAWWDGEVRDLAGAHPLPRSVQPGEIVEFALDVDVPETSGPSRLHLDLVLERIAWFGGRLGEPLAIVDVEIVGSDGAGSQAESEASEEGR